MCGERGYFFFSLFEGFYFGFKFFMEVIWGKLSYEFCLFLRF